MGGMRGDGPHTWDRWQAKRPNLDSLHIMILEIRMALLASDPATEITKLNKHPLRCRAW